MNKKISFPHMGYYYIPISYIIKNITKCEIVLPEYNNSKTITNGSKYSPNEVCMPFKYNLGSYLNALNKGANILIQAGGGCRYGYYAELQEQILKEQGYDFKFINLIKNNHVSIIKLYKETKKINNKLNIISYFYYLISGLLMIIYIDKIHKYLREHAALSKNQNDFITIFNKLKKSYMNEKINIIEIIHIYHISKKELLNIPLNKESKPIEILLIGELYTLMDNAANNYLEDNLISNGCIVYRYTDLTYLLLKKRFAQNKILKTSRKYLKYRLGADGTESIYHVIRHAKKGIDGIIHMKSYSCVPEINAMPILARVSDDYKIPIMYLSYDGENNIANIDTKLEAFYDMISSKRNKN